MITNDIVATEIQSVHAVVQQVAETNGVEIVSVKKMESFMAGDIEMLGIIYVDIKGAWSVTEFVGLGMMASAYTRFVTPMRAP